LDFSQPAPWHFFSIYLWWLSIKMYWNMSSHWLSLRIKYGKKVLKTISNMTKFYCPNKSIYYFFKINTKISTSFRRSMLISFGIDVPGADPWGRAHPARVPTLTLEKLWFFGVKSWFFTRNTPTIFAPPCARHTFFKCASLTWNPWSAPIDLNMYIINVIAYDEFKIGLYEIYFVND
jgi:hypothetical protein